MAELRSDPMVMRTYPNPADAIEAYLRFIYLAAVLPKGAVPNKAIDAVWHAHISHTRAYSQFCRVVVRRFIHHNPSPRTPVGPDEATRDRFRDTQEAERREFSRTSLEAAEASHGGGLILGFLAGSIALIFAAVFAKTLFSSKILTILVLIGVIVLAFRYIVKATNTEPQPAGHPSRKKKSDQSGSGDSGSAGPEVFYLSGQPGGSTGEGCTPGSTTAEACALDGNGDGGASGDGDGGSSCSSCGGGGD